MQYTRGEVFEEGQVWSSPRGTLYKVVLIKRSGFLKPIAHLRKGEDGKGRLAKRYWDDVINWTIESAAPRDGNDPR